MSEKKYQRSFGRIGVTLGIALAFALAIPVQVSAQEEKPGAKGHLEEIVVTARRREESLQDTPIAISAFSAETIRSMGIVNSRDMAAFTPNMQSISQGGFGGNFADNISIRGSGSPREFPDSEQSVGVYVDDVFFPRSVGNVVEVVQLERVEVLRGPQGTLFGRNTMSGAIRYVTKKPNGDFDGSIEAKIGSYSRSDISGHLNFPISENWSGIVSFGKDSRDGFVDHVADNLKSGSKNAATMRAALRYQKDKWTIDLAATEITRRNDGPPRYITEAGEKDCNTGFSFHCFVVNDPGGPYDSRYNSPDQYTIYGGGIDPDYLILDQTSYSATVNYDISDTLSFKSVLSYSELDYEWSQDADASPLAIFDARFGETNDFSQQEFQLNGNTERLHWVVGLFLYQDNPHYNQFTRNTLQGIRVRDQYFETDSWAVFTQGTYDFSDTLSLTVGARYTDEEKSLRSVFTERAGPLNGLEASNSESWDDTTLLVNLAYQPTESLMVYGSYSEGFKSGGINFNLSDAPNPPANFGILPFDPEESTNYEVGLKWTLSGGNVVVNTAAFLMDISNQQLGGLLTYPGGFHGLQVNAGEVSTSGLEVDFQAALSENFLLRGTLSLLDGEFDSIGTAANTVDLNSELGLSPATTYSLGAQYDVDLAGGSRIAFNVDYSWRDEMEAQANVGNHRTLDDLTMVNAGVEYFFPNEDVSIELRGTNLTDEFYFTHLRNGELDAPFGQTSADIGRPREWSLSVNARF